MSLIDVCWGQVMRELQWGAALHIKIGHNVEKGELSTTI
jgi:hypothetical protein